MKMENKDFNLQYTESLMIDFPIEVKYVTDDNGVASIYIPVIDTYASVKDINNTEDVKHKINGLVNIWIRFNLDHHMHNKPYRTGEKK